MRKIIGLLSSIAFLVTGIWAASQGAAVSAHDPAGTAAENAGLLTKPEQRDGFSFPHPVKFTELNFSADSNAFQKRIKDLRNANKGAGEGFPQGLAAYNKIRDDLKKTLDPNDPMTEKLIDDIAARDLIKRMQSYYEVVGDVESVATKRKEFARYSPVQLPLALAQKWTGVYGRNKDLIDSSTKLFVIGSAAAFMFNKFGGSEYVRNKIREIFDKPPIYTVRRRKAGFFGSKQTDLIKEEDLILAPSTRKQVNELIFLIRRRYEMGKTSKRKFTFPHVLLYGPPGTGKTTIAQMIADNTIGDDGNPMNFIKLMASDFMQIKQEADRLAVLKEMFTKAKNLGNTIIFLDEVDGMVQQRGKDAEGPNRAFLDMLLLYMTKLSSRYMVIAATNHANKIDDALMSRFRRKIFVNLPTARNRKAILELYIENLLTSKGYTSQLDTTAIANAMQGCSGRDLESFITRLRDRLDFEQSNVATPALADVILREMGKIPGGSDDDISLLDLEDELAPEAATKK